MELVAKSQMQQILFDVLKALDEWEYPYESVTVAKGKLRVAVNLLGNDMEDIQKLIEKEKGEETYGKNNP